MGLWDMLTGEFVDVIDWTDNTNDTLVYRFDRQGNNIKYGAKLTVRESQMAIFVNEGEVADVLGPGMYVLETRNLPILTTLQHWDHGFNSPFKAEVYFFSMRQFTGLKWGTRNPIIVRDPEFGPVRIRAFGTYAIRITDARKFMQEITGTDRNFSVEEISDQLRDLIVTRFSTIIANSNIPVLDMAANTDQLSKYITERITPEFANYGLALTQVLIENISLPPEVEAVLDKRTSMGLVGNLDQYLKYQTAESLGKGQGNSGIEMGVGFAMANQMANSLNANPNVTPSHQVPPQTQVPPKMNPSMPPQPTEPAEWHVAMNNNTQAVGPITLSALQDHIRQGQINRDTLVWQIGMDSWQAAGSVSALTSNFASTQTTPPPLPNRAE
ncbi:MAG: SPFH domain-containing protein [Thiofilum sp.]|uniref:SPFH domain-containing protein n=1 Tax=Thiofilum sp. TaxID=2212733 RepID=UPI0025EE4D6F|nr:SPFH domain-containing protein [Thiofilum sp.]MBK8452002.1 SPFH domain-containing protein [Thiofilum sp.]